MSSLGGWRAGAVVAAHPGSLAGRRPKLARSHAVLTLLVVLSSWRTIIPNTCKVARISTKRRRRHGCEGVRWLELSERVRRAARLRYLFEPAAGGRGVAESDGWREHESSFLNCQPSRAGWPQCGAQVSCTSCPCAQRCLACPLADVSHACGRPRVQETGNSGLVDNTTIRRL